MKYLAIILGLISITMLVILVYLFVGGYNVAASRPYASWVDWTRNLAVERSVKREGAKLIGPKFFNEVRARRGARIYHEQCAVCHGGPGVEPTLLGISNPPASDLSQTKRTREEVFWVTKHGLKLRAMPAYGHAFDDRTLWEIATFVMTLSQIDSAGYARVAGPRPAPAPPARGR